MNANNPPAAQTVDEFSLPEGAVIEGYCIDKYDGLRYPYGRSNDGFWKADTFGWAQWMTREQRDTAIGDNTQQD